MPDELNLIDIMKSWLGDKFPEIMVVADEHLPRELLRLRIDPVLSCNPYTGLIGAVQWEEVMLWDQGETKLGGGRYVYYDPRDPKFFQQMYEHLVRICESSKKGDNYGY